MPLRYIPAVIIFFALIGSTIYFYHMESSYIKGMSITSGVVVSLGNGSTFSTSDVVNLGRGRTSSTTIKENETTVNTQALVDFQVNGSTYRVEGRAFGYPRWKIGQSVDVYFSPKNPSRARIKRWDELYFFTALSASTLIFCVLLAVINFIVYIVRGRPLS